MDKDDVMKLKNDITILMSKNAAQAETIRRQKDTLESLSALIEEQMGDWYAVEFAHLPVAFANLAHMRDAIETLDEEEL